MSFRDRIKEVMEGVPVEPQNPFEGFAGAVPQHVRENESGHSPNQRPERGPRDTFLELLKRRSGNLTYAETSPPSSVGVVGDASGGEHARIILQIRQGSGPSKPPKALLAASIRNSMAIYEHQANPNRCHVCAEPEDPSRPFVPVLNAAVCAGNDRAHHWLHHGCLEEHGRRIEVRVEALIEGRV